MRPIFLSLAFSFVIIFASVAFVDAQGLVPCSGPDCQACHFVELGQNIITWFISIMASIIALVFAIGGFKMLTSAGDTGAVSDAKSMMTNSVIGFVILLSAWLIVNTIMVNIVPSGQLGNGSWFSIQCVAQPARSPAPTPKTPTDGPTDACAEASDPEACVCEARGGALNLNTGECEGGIVDQCAETENPAACECEARGGALGSDGTCAGGGETACAIPPLSPVTDPAAQQLESNPVVWTNTAPGLQACVNKFIAKVGGTVTSAYRPPAYQTHLAEIRDRWCSKNLRSNTEEACSALKSTISAEVQKHFGGNWNCGAVASTNSTHSSGNGVDISGINHSSPSVQAAASESCLTWNNYPNDPWHYTLKSGCTCN
jgi:hypothetical protein